MAYAESRLLALNSAIDILINLAVALLFGGPLPGHVGGVVSFEIGCRKFAPEEALRRELNTNNKIPTCPSPYPTCHPVANFLEFAPRLVLSVSAMRF